MPTTTVTVSEVKWLDTFFTVYGHDDRRMEWKFTTNRRQLASLAARAKQTGQTVRVQWEDSRRFGNNIVSMGVTDAD